ncbi:hypothetical protein A3H19_00435 [Candidatus Woesebacteria bacterium RIFCSPLOWO2_12_FULL_39_9]|nr:MAG: hypothetical protein A3H19_00435 [Candidatus Woesebacteria bacterium RIFCSPLOWO2_12_FULL_39_9]
MRTTVISRTTCKLWLRVWPVTNETIAAIAKKATVETTTKIAASMGNNTPSLTLSKNFPNLDISASFAEFKRAATLILPNPRYNPVPKEV